MRYCCSGFRAKPAAPQIASAARVPGRARGVPASGTSSENPRRERPRKMRMAAMSLA